MAGLLVALLALLGFAVVLLFLVWLTSLLKFKNEPPPVEFLELAGRGAAALGVARDLEEPGMEELADVIEPQVSETLEAVTDVVSTQAGAMEAFDGNAAMMGTGSGLGDSRGAGPGGEGTLDVVPPWERWQIRWSTNSVASYAKQLDHFGVQLGLVGGGRSEIEYAFNLSKAKPDTSSAPDSSNEKRLNFNYAGGPMVEMDLKLLARAGWNTRNRQSLQFFPQGTADQLLRAELTAADGRTEDQILKTVFGIRGSEGNYEFYVIDQQFRTR